jgi:hypothetical protein
VLDSAGSAGTVESFTYSSFPVSNNNTSSSVCPCAHCVEVFVACSQWGEKATNNNNNNDIRSDPLEHMHLSEGLSGSGLGSGHPSSVDLVALHPACLHELLKSEMANIRAACQCTRGTVLLGMLFGLRLF